MARLILLDRDGVINLDSPEFVKTPQEWQAIPGSLEAIAQLKNSGRRVAVCSNQSGVARGIVSLDMLKAIENKMLSELQSYGAELDLVLYCTHHPDEQCGCRKPAPGMLENAMSMLAIDTADTCFVGDSLRDIQAAEAAGCLDQHSLGTRPGGGQGRSHAGRPAPSHYDVYWLEYLGTDA